jgi:hypothetical protein
LAADAIDAALAEAMKEVLAAGGTDEKFKAETGDLYSKIYGAERELERKRKIEALTEKRLEDIEKKLEETEKRLNEEIKNRQQGQHTTAPGSTPNQ